jgi:uncharacterized membrane protein YfcA
METLWFLLWLLGAATLVFVAFVAMFFVLQEEKLIRWPEAVRWLAAAVIAAGLAFYVYRYSAAEWPYFAVMSCLALIGWRFFRGFARGFAREFVNSFKASFNKHNGT